jgi:hypothetical protein
VSPTVEELERQIDDTRHALDQTLHTLQFELSPRHQLEQAWHFAKERTGRSYRAGADWATANPVPVVLGAVALTAALYFGVSELRRRR